MSPGHPAHTTVNTSVHVSLLHTGMMLKENNTLKKLDLDGCGLQPEGLEEVIKGVQVNTKLETLVLSRNTIDNKRASCLGKNDIMQVCPYMYERALHHISVHYLPNDDSILKAYYVCKCSVLCGTVQRV